MLRKELSILATSQTRLIRKWAVNDRVPTKKGEWKHLLHCLRCRTMLTTIDPVSPFQSRRINPSSRLPRNRKVNGPMLTPLRGRSLGVFGPDNWLRLWLCEVLVHPITEPFILILIVIQTVVLAVDSARAVDYMKRPMQWTGSWANYVLLGLFFIYTLEIVVRIIVSGFVRNAEEYSTSDMDLPFLAAISNRMGSFFMSQRRPTASNNAKAAFSQPSIIRFFHQCTGSY